jgi:protein TonB
MTQLALSRSYDLPWTAGAEQERAFRKTLKVTLAAMLVLALLLAFLPSPRRDPALVEEIPQRFARLVIERPEPPPPPPAVREEPPQPEPAATPEQKAEPEPAPEPEPVVEPPPSEPAPAPVEAPQPDPAERTQQARERASTAGLLPFAQQLAALRDSDAVERLDHKTLGAAVEASVPVTTERSVITSRVGRGSGGIDTAALSRDTGASGLAGRTTTRVESPVEGSAPSPGGSVTRTGQSSRGSRSREEIERVFDKNKGAIYALYNRALRQNPALEGKVVLRLTIAPDGRVTACEVVSSELGDAELEGKLVRRVLLFKFEARDVEPITTTKPIDFFPA